METAFRLNRLTPNHVLRLKTSVIKLLTSYFIVEHLNGNSTSLPQHHADKANIAKYYPHWPDTLKFIEDIQGDDAFQRRHSSNPFKKATYSFEDVSRVAQTLSEKFGPFSN